MTHAVFNADEAKLVLEVDHWFGLGLTAIQLQNVNMSWVMAGLATTST